MRKHRKPITEMNVIQDVTKHTVPFFVPCGIRLSGNPSAVARSAGGRRWLCGRQFPGVCPVSERQAFLFVSCRQLQRTGIVASPFCPMLHHPAIVNGQSVPEQDSVRTSPILEVGGASVKRVLRSTAPAQLYPDSDCRPAGAPYPSVDCMGRRERHGTEFEPSSSGWSIGLSSHPCKTEVADSCGMGPTPTWEQGLMLAFIVRARRPGKIWDSGL
jgi:hypothetical protein